MRPTTVAGRSRDQLRVRTDADAGQERLRHRVRDVQELNQPLIATQPLAGTPPMLPTYLMRRGGEPSKLLKCFLLRARGDVLAER